MKKPCLYILCGLSFAGKTTLAKEMVNVLGIKRVSIDDINTERGIWDDETGLSLEEWEKTYEIAYQRIAMFLSQGESVVDESTNFTKEQRDRLRAIAEQYNTQTCVIFLMFLWLRYNAVGEKIGKLWCVLMYETMILLVSSNNLNRQ